MKPLNSATRALARAVAPTTAKLRAYVSASPRLSNAPDNKDDEPLIIAAAIIMTNVSVLITNTSANTRR